MVKSIKENPKKSIIAVIVAIIVAVAKALIDNGII